MLYDCGDGVKVDVERVSEIARRAGEKIMEVYHTETDNWDVKAKADDSPLTVADLRANELICTGLQELYPTIPIVSEENKQLPFEERQGRKNYWCIDPLDGTKEFIKRNGQFTVNIALCEGDTPVLGVVVIPAQDPPVTYFAVKGHGAYKENPIDRYPERIRCAEFDESDEGLKLVASASHCTAETEAFIAQYRSPELVNIGSSIKLLLVAEGSAHVYPRLAPTCEWDTCAAHAIVLEAGGEVLQVSGSKPPCVEGTDGQPVVYNKPSVYNPWFVVYGRRKPKAAVAKAAGGDGPGPITKLLVLLAPLLVAVAAWLYLRFVGA